jgi:hypothetical protein
MIRAGDTVYHRPSGESWTVAYCDGEWLAWCGWPAGEAKISDCELKKSCSDDQHRDILEQWAEIYKRGRYDSWDRRPCVCFDQLCLLNQVFVGAGI